MANIVDIAARVAMKSEAFVSSEKLDLNNKADIEKLRGHMIDLLNKEGVTNQKTINAVLDLILN